MVRNCPSLSGLGRLRPVIALGALLAIGALDAQTAAHAQRGVVPPWCANTPFRTGDCTYYTLEQCLATARGFGSVCTRNPRSFFEGRERGRRERWDRWNW
jgi:hypothetical protein